MCNDEYLKIFVKYVLKGIEKFSWQDDQFPSRSCQNYIFKKLNNKEFFLNFW